jgi:hypothetical protein
MNSDVLKGRVAQLQDAVTQSTHNHYVLTGQLQEAKVVLEQMLTEESESNDVKTDSIVVEQNPANDVQ